VAYPNLKIVTVAAPTNKIKLTCQPNPIRTLDGARSPTRGHPRRG
jgi:hypothetical protein